MNSCIVIPARYNSSRFPGKPLAKINNKEMILWVAELSSKVIGKNHVFIATDDIRIKNKVEEHGFNSIMTKDSHETGTDRVAEAVKSLNYEIIINVQGDEPILNPIDIEKCIELKKQYPNYIINFYSLIGEREKASDTNIPKVVINRSGFLLYISRAQIPSKKNQNDQRIKYKKQVCIYGFNKNQLKEFYDYGKKSDIEKSEDIEIIRFLELNKKVYMYESSSVSYAVDIPDDITKLERYINSRYE